MDGRMDGRTDGRTNGVQHLMQPLGSVASQIRQQHRDEKQVYGTYVCWSRGNLGSMRSATVRHGWIPLSKLLHLCFTNEDKWMQGGSPAGHRK